MIITLVVDLILVLLRTIYHSLLMVLSLACKVLSLLL